MLVKMAIGYNFVGLLKPTLFKLLEVRDPEKLLQDRTKYTKQYNLFLYVTKAEGAHTEGHVNCSGCSMKRTCYL